MPHPGVLTSLKPVPVTAQVSQLLPLCLSWRLPGPAGVMMAVGQGKLRHGQVLGHRVWLGDSLCKARRGHI